MFQSTTAAVKIRELTARKRIVQGGTSAGKTIAIIAWLVSRAVEVPKLEISIISETIPHLRRGALKDFLKLMQGDENFHETNYNKSHLTYTFENGSYIEFFSADQEMRLTGARRDILYINEANNVSWEAYHQLAIRTKGIIWIDYNPTCEFWVHTELLKDSDAEMLVLTYLDNETLAESIKKDIEQAREKAKDSSYWANWWMVYGLGMVGKIEGLIYTDWHQINDAEFPFNDTQFFAIDWGFSNSPTVMIRIVFKKDCVYVHQEIYQTGLSNAVLINMIKSLGVRRELIIADSENPKDISELADNGLNVKGSIKFPGYVNKAIENLQAKKIYVTKSSTNLIKELRSYTWMYDKKKNEYINTPVKEHDHALDAMKDACYILGHSIRKIKQHN